MATQSTHWSENSLKMGWPNLVDGNLFHPGSMMRYKKPTEPDSNTSKAKTTKNFKRAKVTERTGSYWELEPSCQCHLVGLLKYDSAPPVSLLGLYKINSGGQTAVMIRGKSRARGKANKWAPQNPEAKTPRGRQGHVSFRQAGTHTHKYTPRMIMLPYLPSIVAERRQVTGVHECADRGRVLQPLNVLDVGHGGSEVVAPRHRSTLPYISSTTFWPWS